MPGRRRLILLAAACLGALAVAGCAAAGTTQPVAAAVGSAASVQTSQSVAPSPASSPQGVNVAAFDALAEQEANAWPRSPLGKLWKTGLVIPSADDLTMLPPLGFPSQETQEAFGNGDLVFTGPPPSGAPPAVIKWTNLGLSSGLVTG